MGLCCSTRCRGNAGARGSYTLAGPPEKMNATGSNAAISSALTLAGNI